MGRSCTIPIFKRYTDQSKRVIFYARLAAIYEHAPIIDSSHLLLGLLTESDNRANTIFHLSDQLPEEAARQVLLKTQPAVNKALPLSIDSKRVVAYTAEEANQLKDFWIDTEHLVLGILRNEDCTAAKRLREIGLQIEQSRQLVADNIGSRPFRLPALWWSRAFWNRPVDSIATLVLLGGLLFGFISLAYILR